MISPAGSGFYISFDQIEYVDSVAVSVFMNSLAKFDHECCMVDPVRPGFRIFLILNRIESDNKCCMAWQILLYQTSQFCLFQ